MTRKIGIRNQRNGGIHHFDDLFAAIQFQKQTAYGRMWLNTPMPLVKYPELSNKKLKDKRE